MHKARIYLILVIVSGCSLFPSFSFAQQWNGLTYYNITYSPYGYLCDTNGVVVKTWTFTGGAGYSAHMGPGGDVYRTVQNLTTPMTGGGVTGQFQKWNYNGTLLWDMNYFATNYVLHHDICPLPNGNVLAICYDLKTPADVALAGGTSGITTWSERIIEFKQTGLNTGTIVWQWDLWDHLVQNVNAGANNYQTSIVNHPELLDINFWPTKEWLHVNGVDYNPVLDQIVFSSHYLNEWYIIDHSTTTAEAASHAGGNAGKGGDFLYRWGNPAAYQASGPMILNVPHDAHWVPEGSPGTGNLASVNNRGVLSPLRTTIDQITVTRTNYNYTIALGSAFTPSTYLSRYITPSYSSNMGSSQELPNGNQLICQAMGGYVYEIDPGGNTIWTKTTGGNTPQSHRYTQCYLNNLPPQQPTVSLNGLSLVSTNAITYQWYLNGNLIIGATTQSHTPAQNGIYLVRTTDANGCVNVYSSGYKYTLITMANEIECMGIKIGLFPNPVEDKLNIVITKSPETIIEAEIKLFDIVGKEISSPGKINISYDRNLEIGTSGLSNGVYFIRVKINNVIKTLKFQKIN